MIVIKIFEGLAGQMFQYSLGRYLSVKHNTDLYLDLSWYDTVYNKNPLFPREFGLDKLNTRYKVVDHSTVYWKLKFSDKFKRINPFKLRFIQESDYTIFNEAVITAGNNILLEGFFPCYKYFESIRNCLVKELSSNKSMDAKNARCLERIKSSNAVSIHFRRGDYALTSFHGILDKRYYDAAVKFIGQKVADPYLFIFSDDPDWVRQNMKFDFPYEIIDFNKNDQNYFDIELMKYCKHNIIANSGFSWWGAWLNENPDKIIVAPKKWVNGESATMQNIPEGWIVI